jgi:hypothetical protein
VLLIIGAVGSAAQLIFYLALFLDRSPLFISSRVRLVCRAFAALTALARAYWLWSNGFSVGAVGALLSDVALITILIAFSCYEAPAAPCPPPSQFLRVTKWIALAIGSLLLAQAIYAICMLPREFLQFREMAGRYGRDMSVFWPLVWRELFRFVSAAALFLPPWIVWAATGSRLRSC